jgi:acyl-CoA reductase-like NAD-dependent aldehyde dehydrogenase
MAAEEQRIQAIVEQVIAKLAGDPEIAARLKGGGASGASSGGAPAVHTRPAEFAIGRKGVFGDIDSAVQAARDAFEQLHRTSLAVRAKGLENIRRMFREHNVDLANKAVAETTFGRVEDKIAKNRLVADKTPGLEILAPWTRTGDDGLVLHERAPYGVIAAITPVTNATETPVCNTIGMVAGGNAVVFNPHPGARRLTAEIVTLMNEALMAAGCPENLACTVAEPTIQSADRLMRHPGTPLVVVTGGPGVVKAAMATGKKVIAAGPGNPPAVVDDTVDLRMAARNIIAGASLDNNIVCIVEKEIVALESIADNLRRELVDAGAFLLNERQVHQLEPLLVKDGKVNTKFVGKNPSVILREIGVRISDDVRIAFCEVDEQHPFVQEELLLPVIPMIRCRTVDECITTAKRVEHGFRHTATMHSNHIGRLHQMAVAMDCSIFVKNGPSFAGLGLGGEGYTSFTIASPTGEGLTTALNFTRDRRCTLKDAFRIV